MKEAVYIFGAGASFGSHPIISEFGIAIDLIKHINPHNISEKLKEIEGQLDIPIDRLIAQFKTPDNYAKWLFVSGNAGTAGNPSKKYLAVKKLYELIINEFSERAHEYQLNVSDAFKKYSEAKNLSLYESDNLALYKKLNDYFQNKKTLLNIDIESYKNVKQKNFTKCIDSRYLLFFLNIFKNSSREAGLEALNKIDIFTWNYDRNLDYAINSIFDVTADEEFNGAPYINYLNGHVSAYGADQPHCINFYWDSESKTFELPDAKEYIYIGYSFPEYNYEIDQQIIKKALQKNKVGRLIIQSPDCKKIWERLSSFSSIEKLINGLMNNSPSKTDTKLAATERNVKFIENVDKFYVSENLL